MESIGDTTTSNYREIHEAYMQNLNGTTALETYFLIVPSFLNIFICLSVIHIITPLIDLQISKLSQFLIEFCVIVLPNLLWLTVLSDYIKYVFLSLLCISTCILIYFLQFIQHTDFSKIKFENKHRHFITNARSTINVLTAICILAVDFQIFPRRFAKTETFGFGLMDVGVGLYVCSNGVVASHTLKDHFNGFFNVLFKSFISCTPLFILGSVRFVLTNELDYQLHVSEYGVHWNFFITLAVTKMLSTIILYLIPARYSLPTTIFLILLQEYLLQVGLQEWVLSDIKRSTFLTANREGIVSSLGYVAIYFLAIQVSNFMNLKETISFKDNVRLLYKLIIISVITLILTFFCEKNFGVSRRLANSGYILWILFIGVTMLTFFLAVELCLMIIFISLKPYFEKYSIRVGKSTELTSIILEAVNFNGLTFFLLANVLTGLVNLTIQTLTVGPLNSFLILCIYILTICAAMSAAIT
ncbi:phosphatidylinositol-glycan biosynthesis class W protein-like [Chrysoperla carnea]|uniref:phosphatidylinositol-glycan biosynthesis class W protein-like n=1 Tax=Chrysoperla carnea TaxID=189513 RepID=UPI001D06D922|nr:phosphatidylinositol-glycan biosynthesis class W protein-like [Chrysoperla carnea]